MPLAWPAGPAHPPNPWLFISWQLPQFGRIPEWYQVKPSGKRLHNYGKSPFYSWLNSLCLWPFWLAFWCFLYVVHQRVIMPTSNWTPGFLPKNDCFHRQQNRTDGRLPKASSSLAASMEAGEEPSSLKSAWSEFSSRTLLPWNTVLPLNLRWGSEFRSLS